MKIRLREDFEDLKKTLVRSIGSLKELTSMIGHESLDQTVGEIQDRVNDPFLFVIVGEVKAGKSSFINALLGSKEEICKVAPSPMTDTIQQIVYGEEIKETIINPYLKRISQPVEILKEIAIVDTPGTNTIVDHHQEITERFIPHADLIVFVFEAKNPYRQSSWEFFDYIKEEWHKKIIFVLQQKDLMEAKDLEINFQGVRDHAIKKRIAQPQVFSVSAKMELEDQAESGFENLKTYIDKNITGGRAPYLKLQNNAITGKNINDKIGESIDLRSQQWELDKRFREDINETLDNQSIKTERQVDFLVENLLASYDRITNKTYDDLSGALSFIPMIKRSLSSLFGNKESNPKAYLDNLMSNFEKDLNIALKEKLQDGVVDIADNIQLMGKLVDSKIKTSQTILKESDEIFADIADKRANVLRDLQRAFSQFMKSSENFYDRSLMSGSENMAPNLATGGSVALFGFLLTSLNGLLYDITGGILATVGLIFAGVTIGFKKRKILNGFKLEIERGRNQIEGEVTQKLKDYSQKIKHKIDANFNSFDQHLTSEETKLNNLNNLKTQISQDLDQSLVYLKKHLS